MSEGTYAVSSRVVLVADAVMPTERITGSLQVALIIRGLTEGEQNESFWAIVLDARKRVLAVHRVSTGSLTQSIAHPREVFLPCVLNMGAGVIVAHTHPSGDPSPSPEDKAVTRRLREAAELLAIPLLDHVIVGTHPGPVERFSFAEEGWPRL